MRMRFPSGPFRQWLLGHAALIPAIAFAADDPASAPSAPPPPPAPSTAPTAGDTLTQDIIVTGSRRAERILKVPYDITAVSGDDIANQNIS